MKFFNRKSNHAVGEILRFIDEIRSMMIHRGTVCRRAENLDKRGAPHAREIKAAAPPVHANVNEVIVP